MNRGNDVLGGNSLGKCLAEKVLEKCMRQVMGEVKIRQVVTHDRLAVDPILRRFLREWVTESLAYLRLDGLILYFRLEGFRCDHAAFKQLLAHMFPHLGG